MAALLAKASVPPLCVDGLTTLVVPASKPVAAPPPPPPVVLLLLHAPRASAPTAPMAARHMILRLFMKGNASCRVWIPARFGIGSPGASRVECVAQPVAEQVEGHDRQEDGQAGNDHEHRVDRDKAAVHRV